jgi:hypothetical protein
VGRRCSHERVDGGGYPDGLSGSDIPLGARIVFACDAYHAMVSGRPYADALTSAEASGELRRCAGTQFDATVVEVLCAVRSTRATRRPSAREEAPHRGLLDARRDVAVERPEHLAVRTPGERQRAEEAQQRRAAHV